jgi:DNA-binding NarL/FixJ family response regulator
MVAEPPSRDEPTSAPPPEVRLLAWLLPPAMGVLAVVEALSNERFEATPVHLSVVAAWVPAGLVLARWWPAIGAVVVAGFYPVGILFDIPGPGGTGLISTLLAVGWAGFAEPARRSCWGLVAAMLIYAASDTVRAGFSWMNVFFTLIFVAGWWSGVLVQREQRRSRALVEMAAALDAQREAMAEAAVIEERTRIAREIHDAVAHSVSIMTLQIGGLRSQLNDVLEERPAEREVMLGLERLGRQSVEELRSLVGIMRESGTEAPAAPIMDIRMPDVDGIEGTRRVLAAHRDVKVVVLTTFDEDDYIEAALRAGVSGFLLKVSPPEQLIEAVRTVASGGGLLHPSVTLRVIESFAAAAPTRTHRAASLETLTERERDVLRLMARGMSNAEIAGRLYLGEATVKTHVSNVLTKLGVRDRVQAVVAAYETGHVRPGEQ